MSEQAERGAIASAITVVVAIIIAPFVVWAAMFGFISHGLTYGYWAGWNFFDEMFETEASKKRK